MKKIISSIIVAVVLIATICIVGNSCSSNLNNKVNNVSSIENRIKEEKTKKQSSLVVDDNIFKNTSTSQQSSKKTRNQRIKTHKATVVSVVDGDTLWVTIDGKKKKIRFIGVDTPESVNPDESKNTKEGKIASKCTKSRLKKGMTVYVEYDSKKYDIYGRQLGYIWLKSNVTGSKSDVKKYMYNAELLSKGYADTLTIEPNTKYAEIFKKIKQEAKSSSRGFWKE